MNSEKRQNNPTHPLPVPGEGDRMTPAVMAQILGGGWGGESSEEGSEGRKSKLLSTRPPGGPTEQGHPA